MMSQEQNAPSRLGRLSTTTGSIQAECSALTLVLKFNKIPTATKTRILQDSLATLSQTPVFFCIKIPWKLSHLARECDQMKLKGIANDYNSLDNLSWAACFSERQWMSEENEALSIQDQIGPS